MKKEGLNKLTLGASANVLDISLPKKLSTVEELAGRVRQKIISGEMPPGMRLPTTQELAKEWGTYVPAVHAALVALTNEGLLDRRHRKGTFVRSPETRLSRVGVLAPNQLWDDANEFFFIREVFMILEDYLMQQNIRSPIWFEARAGEKTGTPLLPLIKAVERREIQALIALNGGVHNAPWLNALPISVTSLSKHVVNRVTVSMDSFFELALQSLQASGCRSVAFISGIAAEEQDSYDAFRRMVAKFKFNTRDSWLRNCMRVPSAADDFGYRQFRELWREPLRPDGLIVYPDTVARGVMLGISMAGVRLPQDLKVVFHKNAEVPLLCPLPVTFVVNSCLEVVKAFVEQLTRIHAGKECHEILLKFWAEPSPSHH